MKNLELYFVLPGDAGDGLFGVTLTDSGKQDVNSLFAAIRNQFDLVLSLDFRVIGTAFAFAELSGLKVEEVEVFTPEELGATDDRMLTTIMDRVEQKLAQCSNSKDKDFFQVGIVCTSEKVLQAREWIAHLHEVRCRKVTPDLSSLKTLEKLLVEQFLPGRVVALAVGLKCSRFYDPGNEDIFEQIRVVPFVPGSALPKAWCRHGDKVVGAADREMGIPGFEKPVETPK